MAGLPAILAMGFAVQVAWGGDGPIPRQAPADRYAGMIEHSPFALATAAPAAAPAGPSFAANWYIAGIARDGDVDFVTIKSRDATVQFSLRGKEDQQGVVLEQINWSDEPLKSTVSVRKGNELALLQFNEAVVHGPAAQAPAAAAAGTAGGKPVGTPATGVAVPPLPNQPVPSGMTTAPGAPSGPGGSGIPGLKRRIQPLTGQR
jgi:hypothetical protein